VLVVVVVLVLMIYLMKNHFRSWRSHRSLVLVEQPVVLVLEEETLMACQMRNHFQNSKIHRSLVLEEELESTKQEWAKQTEMRRMRRQNCQNHRRSCC
jgi:hypothetical protein